MAQIISKDRVPYRIWDKINGVWNKLNFTTNAKSVDADDGKTLETKVGALNGITSDLSCEDESIAISAKAVNDSLNQVNTNLSANTNYTMTETKIGKLGEDDLYRRVYYADNVNISGKTIIDSNFTGDSAKLISKLSIVFQYSGGVWESDKFGAISSNTVYYCYVRITGNGVEIDKSSDTPVYKYFIIIEYTKP